MTEHEMVATFLKAEINSSRFRRKLLPPLRLDGISRSVVERPDTSDEVENTYRRRLLGALRGFGRDQNLFASFPRCVTWHRCALSKEQLGQVKYMRAAYWHDLSSGSRLPSEAAKNIRAGKKVFGQTTLALRACTCSRGGGGVS